MGDYLLFKWGSLKGWTLSREEDQALMEQWLKLGVSMSAANQRDTPEQKAILCKLIAQFDGEMQNDWSGEMLTKETATTYVMEYGEKIGRGASGAAD